MFVGRARNRGGYTLGYTVVRRRKVSISSYGLEEGDYAQTVRRNTKLTKNTRTDQPRVIYMLFVRAAHFLRTGKKIQQLPVALHASSRTHRHARRSGKSLDGKLHSPFACLPLGTQAMKESTPHHHLRPCTLTLGSPRSLRFFNFSCLLLRPSCLGSSSPTEDDRPSNIGEISTLHSL